MDKNKKPTINPIDKYDNKCFQYTATVALNHQKIGKKSERISKIEPFICKYNWKGTNYLLGKDDWKNFLYAKKEKMHNSQPEKQIAFLMISNKQG